MRYEDADATVVEVNGHSKTSRCTKQSNTKVER